MPLKFRVYPNDGEGMFLPKFVTIYETTRCYKPEWNFTATNTSNIKHLLTLFIKSSADYTNVRKPWLCLRIRRACVLLQGLWYIINLSHPLKPKVHESRSVTSYISDYIASSHPSKPGVLELAPGFLKKSMDSWPQQPNTGMRRITPFRSMMNRI